MVKKTSRKAIDSYMKHEAIIDGAVELGKGHNLRVEATDGNDPRGDIKIHKDDADDFIDLLGRTIDKHRE